jgi:hypothetical protein
MGVEFVFRICPVSAFSQHVMCLGMFVLHTCQLPKGQWAVEELGGNCCTQGAGR